MNVACCLSLVGRLVGLVFSALSFFFFLILVSLASTLLLFQCSESDWPVQCFKERVKVVIKFSIS